MVEFLEIKVENFDFTGYEIVIREMFSQKRRTKIDE